MQCFFLENKSGDYCIKQRQQFVQFIAEAHSAIKDRIMKLNAKHNTIVLGSNSQVEFITDDVIKSIFRIFIF